MAKKLLKKRKLTIYDPGLKARAVEMMVKESPSAVAKKLKLDKFLMYQWRTAAKKAKKLAKTPAERPAYNPKHVKVAASTPVAARRGRPPKRAASISEQARELAEFLPSTSKALNSRPNTQWVSRVATFLERTCKEVRIVIDDDGSELTQQDYENFRERVSIALDLLQ